MGFKCGIIGLPNVGKSTLFNALTQTTSADAENYPFCTIEPNIGSVLVPDDRLIKLAKIAESKKIIPNQMQFVDIAGLVKGASKGEGLGNQFLSHIREVDAIIHVLRCFKNDKITHVNQIIDPLKDNEIIDTELILADIDSIEKQIRNIEKKIRTNNKDMKKTYDLMKKVEAWLGEGKKVSEMNNLSDDETIILKKFSLLTSKPALYVCNVEENDLNEGNELTEKIKNKFSSKVIIVSSLIEAEISLLNEIEKEEFLQSLGIKDNSLSKLIVAGYKLLDLITFFTVGPKEARAWTLKKGLSAPEAAGKIHGDMKKGFIRAETISYNDYIENNGETGCKENGKIRVEGADYIIKDGDILNFRFNV